MPCSSSKRRHSSSRCHSSRHSDRGVEAVSCDCYACVFFRVTFRIFKKSDVWKACSMQTNREIVSK